LNGETVLYSPDHSEKADKHSFEKIDTFTPEGSTSEYQIRTTSLIGPKTIAPKNDQVECSPENNDTIKKMKEQELNDLKLEKIESRMWFNDGILEGI